MTITPKEECKECNVVCNEIESLKKKNDWLCAQIKLIDSVQKDIIALQGGQERHHSDIGTINEWIRTWPPNHMDFARIEIDKDEAWKRQMEKELQETREELRDSLHKSEKTLLTRFNIILGGVAVGVLIQLVSLYKGA